MVKKFSVRAKCSAVVYVSQQCAVVGYRFRPAWVRIPFPPFTRLLGKSPNIFVIQFSSCVK